MQTIQDQTITHQSILDRLSSIHQGVISHNPSGNGLMNGRLGSALFCIYYGQLSHQEEISLYGFNLLEQAFEAVNQNSQGFLGYSLSNGLAGLGATFAVLQKDGFLDLELDALLAPLDEMLYTCSLAALEHGQFDYLHQASGVIQYFNIRNVSPTIQRYQKELAHKLITNASHDDLGFRYKDALRSGNDNYDLGLAHGLSGVLLSLANIKLAEGENDGFLLEALNDGIKYILRFRKKSREENDHISWFPTSVFPNEVDCHFYDRLAWCYGDLNQLLLLYTLADRLNRTDLGQIADEIGRITVDRVDREINHVDHAQFCHGSAGLAQVYKGLFHLSGQVYYQNASHYWLTQTIEGLETDLLEGTYQNQEYEVLEGLIGTGLVLMDHLYEKPLSWPQLFLIP